jgi:hypothetical protein
MGERANMLRQHHIPRLQFSCTKAEEGAYLRRADLVIGITQQETAYFNRIAGIDHAMTITHVSQPKFIQKNFQSVRNIGIVASRNLLNIAMIQACLAAIAAHVTHQKTCPFVVHIIGDIQKSINLLRYVKPKMHVFYKPWVKMHGFVANIDAMYMQMDLMVSPITCGTGMNIKNVEAMAYGMPLLSTRHGTRGIDTTEPLHLHQDMAELIGSLFALHKTPSELSRLAQVSQQLFLKLVHKNTCGLDKIFNHPKINNQCT